MATTSAITTRTKAQDAGVYWAVVVFFFLLHLFYSTDYEKETGNSRDREGDEGDNRELDTHTEAYRAPGMFSFSLFFLLY